MPFLTFLMFISESEIQAESFHPPTTRQTEIVKAARKFESEHKECVRVLPYEENDQMVIHLYVFSGESGIPESLKEDAEKCFKEMGAKPQYFDMYNDAADVLNVTGVEYPSDVPQELDASQSDEISEIISQNCTAFDKHRNVTSLQASFKITDSKETENPCITIYVLGKGHIPIGESEFPGTLGSYPVDVVDGFWFLTSDPWKPNKAQTPGEVLHFGASIGVEGEDASGTLGAIVKEKKSGTLYALSCDHVMQPTKKSEIIHPSLTDYQNYLKYHLHEYRNRVGTIVCPGYSEMNFSVDSLQEAEMKEKFEMLKGKKARHLQESDSAVSPKVDQGQLIKDANEHEKAFQTGFSNQPRVIGTYRIGLRQNVNWTDGKEYFIDAAIAELNEDEGKHNRRYEVIGTSDNISDECCPVTEALKTVELFKTGRTTEYTGKGRLVQAPMFLKPPLCREGEGDGVLHHVNKDGTEEPEGVWWKNCLCIEGRSLNYTFVAPGDSGAMIFKKEKKENSAAVHLLGVGILFAEHYNGHKVYAIASRLDVALKALSQKITKHQDCDLRVVSN